MQSLLQKVVQEVPNMGRAEKRVADLVRARPDDVIQMSIAALSETCGVSDPTIIRFCRRLGFEGYQDFKMRLGQSLVPAAPFHYEQITAADSVDSIVRKTCRNSLNAIRRALEDLSPAQIEQGARQIREARFTDIYATGISEINARDAEHKFHRLGLRCGVALNPNKQRLQASFAKDGDLALMFSQSGATRQLVELAETTRRNGADVLSVTAGDSPLAAVSDHVIVVTPYERTELLTPLASRLNHSLVVNMLVTVIAVLTGNQFPDQLPALDSWEKDKL